MVGKKMKLFMKFKKTPVNKLTLFIIFLIASLMLLLLVIDSNALATSNYGNALTTDLLSGKTATVGTGQLTTGTITKMSTSNPNGIGVGRSSALGYWTGGGNNVYFKLQAGFYDGIDTWTMYSEPNLIPSNIANGVSILGVTGNSSGVTPTHGSQVYTTPGSYSWTAPAGIASLTVLASGGGGGAGGGIITSYYNGGRANGGGGGGGGGTYVGSAAVTPGQTYTVVVGGGGAGGTAGTYNYPWSCPCTEIPAGNAGAGGDSSVAGAIGHGGAAGGSAYGSGSYFYQGTGGAGGAGGGYGTNGGAGGLGGYQAPYAYSQPDAYGGTGTNGVANQGGGGNFYTGYSGGNGRVVIQW